ncbi:Remorin family protein [Quillaja saponaria]|uniref:Remorin family protein n=1 Tax=Quillaja saponaria TaxID=32244 RepID=A0AAD7L3Y1_QUISA|nr:Remorin family protein [Quillaja saponaria]
MEHPAKEVQTDPTPGPAKEEKALVPVPPSEVKPVETKSLPVVQKIVDPVKQKSSGGSGDRDIALADVEKEKKLSYVKAWEESEKSKAENKAQKNVSSVAAWENSKESSS